MAIARADGLSEALGAANGNGQTFVTAPGLPGNVTALVRKGGIAVKQQGGISEGSGSGGIVAGNGSGGIRVVNSGAGLKVSNA